MRSVTNQITGTKITVMAAIKNQLPAMLALKPPKTVFYGGFGNTEQQRIELTRQQVG